MNLFIVFSYVRTSQNFLYSIIIVLAIVFATNGVEFMHNEAFVYIVVVSLAGILSSLLCLYAYFRLKDVPGGKSYIFVTLFSAIFTFSYAFELSSSSLGNILIWLSVEYLVLPFIPAFILLMCLGYVGQKLKQWMYYLLFLIPILTIFMHGTNDLHHLYYTSIGLNSNSPFPILKLEYGPWFYVHSLYFFLCFMVSMISLGMELRKTRLFRFRMQIMLMVAGIMVPIIANYFYLNDLSPYGIDLGPVSMSISFILHGAALFSYQMFRVTPVARETVFENMREGVIVLNQEGLLVDYNHAMLDIISTLSSQCIGKPIVDVIGRGTHLAEIVLHEKECDFRSSLSGDNTYYHIRFSNVKNKHKLMKIITFVDVTERVDLQEQLQYLARIDGLTELYNRHFFMEESERLVDSLNKKGGNISIVMFDIDHFKSINDTFGHEAGDLVLARVADVVKKCLGSRDIVGRYGGEEFILCMPDASLLAAEEMADFIRRNISQAVVRYSEKEITVTSSFGISSVLIRGEADQTILQTLIREADQALYAAKRKGRNCVELFEKVG